MGNLGIDRVRNILIAFCIAIFLKAFQQNLTSAVLFWGRRMSLSAQRRESTMRILGVFCSFEVITAVSLLLATVAHSAEPFFEQKDLFISGEAEYHSYHTPALAVTNKGTLLAFCQANRYDTGDTGDIDILLRRSFDGGISWEDPQTIWDDGMQSCSNPTVVVDRESGRIWALMGWKYYADTMKDILAGHTWTNTGWIDRTYRAFLVHSNDDGATWSHFSSIEDVTGRVKKAEWRYFRPGPGAGIQLQRGPHKGRLIFPCAFSSFGKDCGYDGFGDVYTIHDYVHFGAYIVYSDDQGRNWQRSEGVVWPWMSNCQVVELDDGRLMLNMQSYYRKQKCRAVATSEDGGNTWSDVTFDTTLEDPLSHVGFMQYTGRDTDDRNRLLFSNPADPDASRNLTVRLSYDNGQFWPVQKVIEPGEAGNSALATLGDRSIGLVYEKGSHDRIAFARFNLEWLTDGKDKLPDVPQGGYPEYLDN